MTMRFVQKKIIIKILIKLLTEIPGIRRPPSFKIALTLSTLVPWNAICQLSKTSRTVALTWTLRKYSEEKAPKSIDHTFAKT